ncbi:hypothetical protein MJ585_16610 [Klebsiella pneumoniae]|nr:hypothetical protein MJ585_16610 [Klebsiella pneumoniae]
MSKPGPAALNYKEGFLPRLQTDELAKGINEEVVRAISARRNEPQWMLEFPSECLPGVAGNGGAALAESALPISWVWDYSYYSAPSCGNCDETCASGWRGAANRGQYLSDQRGGRSL